MTAFAVSLHAVSGEAAGQGLPSATEMGRPGPGAGPAVPRLICLGASAGGVETLTELLGLLPGDLPVAVAVVMHLAPATPSLLANILDKSGPLPVKFAADGDMLQPARVYVAPPDYHMAVDGPRLELLRGPRENRVRPSVDVLFRSAASLGAGVMAVVLSGMLDDGASGLATVRQAGGVTACQDPAEALFPSMPRHACDMARPEFVLPIRGVAKLMAEWARERIAPANHPRGGAGPGAAPVGGSGPPPAVSGNPGNPGTQHSAGVPTGEQAAAVEQPGGPTEFSCPDCGGVLWEDRDSPTLHFRCRVGHAFSPDSLGVAQTDRLEAALWAAHLALNERADLLRRMRERMEARGHRSVVQRYTRQIEELSDRAELVRHVALEIGEALDGAVKDDESA